MHWHLSKDMLWANNNYDHCPKFDDIVDAQKCTHAERLPHLTKSAGDSWRDPVDRLWISSAPEALLM
ncbi:unnamed protein product [Phytophthora fragariaefolia]|uniref:Unnamed protein product n=1 Tax=Phytophthora fragariaefolia TaxID=1490495 RepID=A0A9W6XN68_9STRA|nr:unnamed protein product [Phytophthora fragariaefolia]